MILIKIIKKISEEHPKLYIWLILQKNPIRIITSPWRKLPDFIIFGCSRSGTVALNRYLSQHPEIIMASRKEVHFFNKDVHFKQGKNWYRSFFPLKIFSEKKIIGEATPSYIHNPKSAKRIFEILPNVKLICMLRNPIDRAYSHYFHNIGKKGRESLEFEDAIEQENSRISYEKYNKIFDGENFFHYSYLDRGLYLEQILEWMKIFPKEQFLFIKNEDLENNIDKTLNDIFKFLNLKPYNIPNKKKINVGNYPPMKKDTRLKLIEFFRENNKKLANFLDIELDWNK